MISLKKIFWLLFLAFSLFNNTFGQNIEISIQKYDIEDGLSHKDVFSTKKDSLGFIWVGTKYGLNRFDGYAFREFTKEKSGLGANEIDYILEDADGWFWLFYTGGKSSKRLRSITLFNPYTYEVQLFEDRFGNQLTFKVGDIIAYCETSDKSLVFSTRNKELIIYTPDQGLVKYSLAIDKPLNGLLPGTQNVIWANKDANTFFALTMDGRIVLEKPETSGLMQSSNGAELIYTIRPPSSISDYSLHSIDTLGYIKDLGPLLPHLAESLKSDLDEALKERHDVFIYKHPEFDKLFIKTGARLFIIDQVTGWGKELTKDYPDLKNPHDFLFLDNDRFCLSAPEGLFFVQINKSAFKRFLRVDPSVSGNGTKKYECRSIVEISPEEVWVNTYQGTMSLTQEPGGEVRVQPSEMFLNSKRLGLDRTAHGLLKDSDGYIWLGIKRPVRYDRNTAEFKKMKNPDGDYLWVIFEDTNKRLWFSFAGHVDMLSDGKLIRLESQKFPGFENAFVLYFHEDRDGKVWLASEKGLFVLDVDAQKITERYWTGGQGKFKLPIDDIYHIHEEESGIFWLATNGNGLIRWDRISNEFKQYTRTDGLSSNKLYAIYGDQYGNLWMSGDRGIIRFNKKEENINTFIEVDGSNHNEYNRTSHFQSADGTIYFGGINGLTMFHPDEIAIEEQNENPLLVISDFAQYDGKKGKLVDKTGDIRLNNAILLKPEDRFFTLEFSLLTYENQNNVRYAYRFEGLDDKHTYIKENKISIGALPPGNYTLKIKGQTSRGHWSSEELAIPITVLRPVYLRWWFLLVSVIVLAILGYAILYLRSYELKVKIKKALWQSDQDKQLIEKQAKELFLQDQLKSRFFANVSHELRTPLTLVLGPIQSALKKGKLDERSRKWLKTARTSGENLMHLVNSILDFSKLDAQKQVVYEEPVILNKEISTLAAQFDSHAESNDIEFFYKNEEDENLRVIVDIQKLKTILNNLLSNAFKYSDPGGKVILSSHGDKDWIRLTVEDTGRGIHPDDQEYVFGRFYQSRYTGPVAEGGTGIGLALSKELAVMMKGDIWLESKFGEGSKFHLELPKILETESDVCFDENAVIIKKPLQVAEETLTDKVQLTVVKTKIQSAHLLLVEDNPDLRQYLVEILSESYTVTAAANGKEALKRLLPDGLNETKSLPDLILSDVMMPQMDGFELLERLKSNDTLRKIPVIMLTARAGIEDKLSALRIGVDDYLTKPFVEEELLVRIENLLSNHRNRQQFELEPDEDEATTSMSEADEEWLKGFEALIEKEFSNTNLTVTWLAEKALLSQRQLNRRLHQLVGMSAKQYLQEYRLHIARKLLEAGRYRTIAEVAYKVGYESSRSFSRIYRTRFGRLPSSHG